MADVNRTVGIIFQGQDNGAGAAASTLSERIEALGLRGTKAADALALVNAKTTELDTSSTKTVGSLGNMSTALQALAGSLVVKAFIDANVELERFTKSMVATTGSSAEAAKAYDYVRDVARRFGIEVGATADSFAKFSAATKGTALEGEGARTIFEAFSGTMSRLGASSADINGAFVQLAQGISKGKFELEDLKSIAERVPGFFDNFARSLSITTPELFKLISAGGIGATEIAKFADALNRGLSGAEFDGYINSMARLRNAIDDAFRDIGNAGAFNALVGAIQVGTASVVGSVAGFRLLGEVIGALFAKVELGSKFDFGAAVSEALDKAARSADGAGRAVGEMVGVFDKAGTSAAASIAQIPPVFSDVRFEAGRMAEEAKRADAALKALGVDPKKFKNDFDAIGLALDDLFKNTAKTGEQALAGFEAALKRVRSIDDLNVIGGKLTDALVRGDISAKDFDLSVAALIKTQERLNKGVKDSSESIEKQAQAAEKAKDKAEAYRLKMEELASNERIKNIEASVTLKVAQLEADTKRVIAAFESINNTVNSTGTAISDLFGLFKDPNLSFTQLSDIRDQINLENKRRDEALKLQGDLTRAQIDNLRAQTAQIAKGDALIKIDGAGLQPHLEAFMWEILKAVQVRVNSQGLSMLLGV